MAPGSFKASMFELPPFLLPVQTHKPFHVHEEKFVDVCLIKLYFS